MEIKDLKALIKIITETDVTEFEMENSEERIIIKRGPEKELVQVTAPISQAVPTAPPPPQGTVAISAPPVTESTEADDKYETINSPIVGTFYRRPSPEADAFADVGSIVDQGQTVCLVEAMKLFNEIEAEFKCKIIEILKEDAAPVEFGEPLFKVERL
ncbi:MAG: acetyl-CoA carboxylase biotin carboxyl carrier protein [Deltaproteobacteria bacterium]|jgi:acetyl-CoA carboxylase biotin carboxyl carrier protein|nr:acetyl-CoA carboxylase biotin carboxyl carrier protein [Deltaproteobacteria bacterium]